jgi:hypothetical protein
MEKRLEQAIEFVLELSRFLPQDARIMFSQFPGDPADVPGKSWNVRALSRHDLNDDMNIYACVMAMKQNEHGEYRRKRENFACGLCLMVDDIGTGPGAKVSMNKLHILKPTALIETSPDNYQAIYMFDRALDDPDYFDAMIRGFIREQLLSKDSGMAGINRVFRIPYGSNCKKKYGGDFKVSLTGADYSLRYSPERIIEAFRIPMKVTVRPPSGIIDPNDIRRRAEFFELIKQEFIRSKMKLRDVNMGGWMHVVCPWVGDHESKAANNTGAALRIPNIENDYNGAFVCWHGTCQGAKSRERRRGLHDVIAHLTENSPHFRKKIRELEIKHDAEIVAEIHDAAKSWFSDGGCYADQL